MACSVQRLHVIAEDGNPVPGASRVQAEVFMAAGKTYDPAPLSSIRGAINHTPSAAGTASSLAPSMDFFGNLRKGNNPVDAGAVE
jgi:hypothetical protein